MHWDRVLILALIVVTLSAPCCGAPGDEQEQKVVIAELGSAGGWLGVVVEDMTERMGRRMGTEVTRGALVNDVVEKSPAERAGLRVDDIIVAVDERTINDGDDLVRAVRKIKPETVSNIAVVRDRKRLTVRVEVGSHPERHRSQLRWVWPGMVSEASILGMKLRNLTGQLAEYFKVPGARGVLVEEVSSGSDGEKAGIQAGDVIIRCGSEPVRDIDDLEWVLEDAKPDQRLKVEIVRAGSRRTLEMRVPEELSGPERFFFRDHMFHFSPPTPDAERLRQRIEIEIPRKLRRELRQERLHIEGLEGSMEALKRELEGLGRQLEREAEQVKKSIKRALRTAEL